MWIRAVSITTGLAPEFYGLDQNYVLQGTTQGHPRLFGDPHMCAHTIGITLSDGVQLDSNGNATTKALDLPRIKDPRVCFSR